MKHFRIRKHDDFQHYKKRNPPWIMLHLKLFGSLDFLSLSDGCKWQALALALIASRYENHLPNDPDWLKAETHSKTKIDLEALLAAKFIVWCRCDECASTLQQDASDLQQDAAHSRADQSKPKQRHTGKSDGARFDDFWKAYPRKLGKDDARKAFAKRSKNGLPDTEPLLAALEAQKQGQWNGIEARYIPHPATWLNRGQWADEIEKPPANGNRPTKPAYDPDAGMHPPAPRKRTKYMSKDEFLAKETSNETDQTKGVEE